jgi:hypothetical protein
VPIHDNLLLIVLAPAQQKLVVIDSLATSSSGSIGGIMGPQPIDGSTTAVLSPSVTGLCIKDMLAVYVLDGSAIRLLDTCTL